VEEDGQSWTKIRPLKHNSGTGGIEGERKFNAEESLEEMHSQRASVLHSSSVRITHSGRYFCDRSVGEVLM
jgi:hypothetical protein